MQPDNNEQAFEATVLAIDPLAAMAGNMNGRVKNLGRIIFDRGQGKTVSDRTGFGGQATWNRDWKRALPVRTARNRLTTQIT